jgi:dCTP deaminase
MILTGTEIEKEVKALKITITPFNLKKLNPNSYNFSLGDQLLVYQNEVLDCQKENPTQIIKIPDEGIWLEPHKLYLGHTLETMGSNHYVPIIRGRSSTGRLGLFINITADLIDIGSINQWTLQLHAVQPLKIYKGMEIGQVTFWKTQGTIELYKGKYQGSLGPRASELFKDFKVGPHDPNKP